MKLDLTDRDQITETELNDLFQKYWEQGKAVDEIQVNKKCYYLYIQRFILSNEFPVYKKCECCGQETTEVDHYEKMKKHKGGVIVYESDYSTVKIVAK